MKSDAVGRQQIAALFKLFLSKSGGKAAKAGAHFPGVLSEVEGKEQKGPVKAPLPPDMEKERAFTDAVLNRIFAPKKPLGKEGVERISGVISGLLEKEESASAKGPVREAFGVKADAAQKDVKLKKDRELTDEILHRIFSQKKRLGEEGVKRISESIDRLSKKDALKVVSVAQKKRVFSKSEDATDVDDKYAESKVADTPDLAEAFAKAAAHVKGNGSFEKSPGVEKDDADVKEGFYRANKSDSGRRSDEKTVDLMDILGGDVLPGDIGDGEKADLKEILLSAFKGKASDFQYKSGVKEAAASEAGLSDVGQEGEASSYDLMELLTGAVSEVDGEADLREILLSAIKGGDFLNEQKVASDDANLTFDNSTFLEKAKSEPDISGIILKLLSRNGGKGKTDLKETLLSAFKGEGSDFQYKSGVKEVAASEAGLSDVRQEGDASSYDLMELLTGAVSEVDGEADLREILLSAIKGGDFQNEGKVASDRADLVSDDTSVFSERAKDSYDISRIFLKLFSEEDGAEKSDLKKILFSAFMKGNPEFDSKIYSRTVGAKQRKSYVKASDLLEILTSALSDEITDKDKAELKKILLSVFLEDGGEKAEAGGSPARAEQKSGAEDFDLIKLLTGVPSDEDEDSEGVKGHSHVESGGSTGGRLKTSDSPLKRLFGSNDTRRSDLISKHQDVSPKKDVVTKQSGIPRVFSRLLRQDEDVQHEGKRSSLKVGTLEDMLAKIRGEGADSGDHVKGAFKDAVAVRDEILKEVLSKDPFDLGKKDFFRQDVTQVLEGPSPSSEDWDVGEGSSPEEGPLKRGSSKRESDTGLKPTDLRGEAHPGHVGHSPDAASAGDVRGTSQVDHGAAQAQMKPETPSAQQLQQPSRVAHAVLVLDEKHIDKVRITTFGQDAVRVIFNVKGHEYHNAVRMFDGLADLKNGLENQGFVSVNLSFSSSHGREHEGELPFERRGHFDGLPSVSQVSESASYSEEHADKTGVVNARV